jgi:AcrR family transcriptional regulator
MTDAQRRSKNHRDTGTRDDLLAAARACVRDRGLAGATSRDIAELAGANLAAITYHFGSKDDLVADALFDELQRRIEPALRTLQGDGDAATVMVTAIARLATDFESSRRDAPLYLEALVAATRSGPYARSARTLLRKVRTRLRGRIADLQEQGLVPGWVDPDAMAALIVAVGNGVALQVSIDPTGPTHQAIAGQFSALLLSVGPA